MSKDYKTDVVEKGLNGEKYRVKSVQRDVEDGRLHRVSGRLIREFKVLGRLQNLDSVVKRHGQLEFEDGKPLFRMVEIPGKSLSRLLVMAKKKGEAKSIEYNPLPFYVLGCLVKLAYALDEVHQKGVVHKDLKPENVLITPDFAPKILDFGLSDVGEFRRPGYVFGTPAYMSPEAAKNYLEADERSDIYSLGCILFACLTGTRVFPGNSRWTMIRHVEDIPPQASERNPNIPHALNGVVMDCLEKDPDNRPQTAEEVGDYLKSIAREKLYMPL
jgi:serine/threonine protein kinase